ncbi:MAG TPA: LamG-like jellyroll fold domain-containing protein [Kofleriaceae bacterium]|jgi:hypothetical protein
MVLKQLVLAILIGGCSQSLFDEHPGSGGNGSGSGSGSGSNVLSQCPAPCLADGGGDFGMTGKNWRYLEDTRNRQWVPMTDHSNVEVGTDSSMNTIAACGTSTEDACTQLPDALLISSAGSASPADPAIEWTSTSNQVVAIELGAYVPSTGTPQAILLYRNSREDSLVTVQAAPGQRASGSIVLDALAGDRFLVAVAPDGGGTSDVGLQFFASQGAGTFPEQCQLAMEFNSTSGSNAPNACGQPFVGMVDDADENASPGPIHYGAGPFAEQGSAATFAENEFIVGADIIDRTADTTTQFWVQQGTIPDDEGSWVFSDYDLNNGGGLGFDIYENEAGTGLALDTGTCTDPNSNPLGFAIATSTYPSDMGWHFIRAVHTNGMLNVCIDGKMTGSVAIPMGGLKTSFPPYDGQNGQWLPLGAFFNGSLDDIRSFKTALPCGS